MPPRKKRLVPTVVQALEAKGVSRVAAGKHFSLFCAGRGIVMAAGHRQLVGTGPIGEDQSVAGKGDWGWGSLILITFQDKAEDCGRPTQVGDQSIPHSNANPLTLAREDIVDICCGDEHAAVLTVSWPSQLPFSAYPKCSDMFPVPNLSISPHAL